MTTRKNDVVTMTVEVMQKNKPNAIKSVAWVPESDKEKASGSKVETGKEGYYLCGGYLFGDRKVRERILKILGDKEIKTIRVDWAEYTFTEGRDTPADLIAIFAHLGDGRGLLSENGWSYLSELLDDFEKPEDGELIIY